MTKKDTNSEFKLKYADIKFHQCFNIETHKYGVNVECSFTFVTREQYLEFVKDWKQRYKAVSHSLRLLKHPVGFVTSSGLGQVYLYGRYVTPGVSLVLAQLSLRIMAKALLATRKSGKIAAASQRERNVHEQA